MVPVSAIDKYNLRDAAIQLITSLDNLYTAEEASDILTNMCGSYVPESEYLELRKTWLLEQKRKSLQPVPLSVPRSPSVVPPTLQELSAFSQINVFNTICGVAEQAYQVYRKTSDEADHKGSIQALRLVMDSSDMIDKKIKAVGGADPTSLIMGDLAFQSIQSYLLELNAEYPEWHLLEKINEKREAQRAKKARDVTEEEA